MASGTRSVGVFYGSALCTVTLIAIGVEVAISLV
jgi:hypothetical protein